MEREKPTLLSLEKQRETLPSSVEVEAFRYEEFTTDDEEAAPGVGRLTAPPSHSEPSHASRASLAPLPVARWAAPRRALELSERQHEALATRAEHSLRRLLASDNYDSVSNFIALHDAFERSSDPLYEVYRRYSPPIRARKHTCVGLSIELVRRWRDLEEEFEGVSEATWLASCEEAVADVPGYVSAGEAPAAVECAEKEHVMVCVALRVRGRAGVLLADPGYHVPRLVTVMMDRAYPHTGWFTQSDEPECRKEYNYTFSMLNPGYVEWHERETRGDSVKCQTSLIYVGRPYLDAVNVTERRNLVYNFRSLLSRDQKGHLLAGLYFPVGANCKDAQFTLFLNNGSQKVKTKYKFSAFSDPDNIPESAVEEIEVCNAKMNYKTGELLSIICKLARVMTNQSFIDQMLEINEDICRMCL